MLEGREDRLLAIVRGKLSGSGFTAVKTGEVFTHETTLDALACEMAHEVWLGIYETFGVDAPETGVPEIDGEAETLGDLVGDRLTAAEVSGLIGS